ncbi:MAG: hypothetical protein ACOX6M_03560 [Armatimonadota bacterium]
MKVGDGGSPSLSADGSKIAWFNANSVWVANTNGPGGVEIAEGFAPSLSADGSKVAWVSYLHGDFEVYVANADGTDVVNVSDDEGYNDQPSLSADGSKVAWQSNRSGDWEVYVASTDGTGLAVNVSNDSDANDYSPSLSADGSKVAWVSNCGGDWEVYVASTDGTGEIVNVSKDPDGGNDSPSLSADGRTVAWQGWPVHSSGYEVRLANSDGTGGIVDVTDDLPRIRRVPVPARQLGGAGVRPALLHVVDALGRRWVRGRLRRVGSGRWRRQGGGLARRGFARRLPRRLPLGRLDLALELLDAAQVGPELAGEVAELRVGDRALR